MDARDPSMSDEAETLERQAIAEVEGGVPAVYSAAFARLQLTPPPGLSVEKWLQAVDDAGRFLDQHGAQAAVLGWSVVGVFGASGLVRFLRGASVVSLSASTATLSDGRSFDLSG